MQMEVVLFKRAYPLKFLCKPNKFKLLKFVKIANEASKIFNFLEIKKTSNEKMSSIKF